jgi:CBS-domain-containing membrane protein
MKRRSRLLDLPASERRTADPDSLTGRIERALGWPGVGVIGFLGAGTVFALLGVLAWRTHLPWVFPSLAPTVVLIFETPLRPQASPRNTILGHLVGIGTGYGFLVAFGLTTAGSITHVGVTIPRIVAAALAVAMTTLVLNSAGMPHPPATSSTLIVSLGLLHRPTQLAVMIAAVLVTTAMCWMLNTLIGVTAPPRSPRPPPEKAQADDP